MNQTAAAAIAPPRATSLRIAASPGDAWSGVVQPWFRENAPGAWKRAARSVVVLPTRPQVNALKARLLEEGFSHLGIEFVTPLVLRELLLGAGDERLASPEHLRLLLAIAAEEALATDNSEQPTDATQTAKAVLRAPNHLLRTLDQLDAAGWPFDELGLRSFEPIVRRFRKHLAAAGLRAGAESDRLALQRCSGDQPLFSRMLVSGFDGAHWPNWILLRAAVQSTEQATILLDYPQGNSDADSCWIGSWEEAYGEAVDAGSSARIAPTDSFFSAEEMRGLGRAKRDCTFLVGANTSEQADAVAHQCVRFLAEANGTRIGVVFSGPGSLPRLVGDSLTQLEIEHHDSIAHSAPGIFETAEWRTWIQLQQAPRIHSLLHFLNALSDRATLLRDLSLHTFERRVRSAHAEVLIDDLEILQQFCSESADGKTNAVAEIIRSIGFLPARATLSEFLRQTEAACTRLRWKTHWLEISRRLGAWIDRHDVELSRALYLRWLSEVASTATTARTPAGDHPYARLQLLTLPQALGQDWSHLIFAGWNEGSWPPVASGEFARDEEIAAFNRSARKLNERASRQGRHGEGHSAIREGHSFYLGPAEKRPIALRQFEQVMNSATSAVAFTANLAQENAPERFANASELFTRVYQQTHRKPLTQAAMSSLQRATAVWLGHARALTTKTELSSVAVAQTRVAFEMRRDPLTAAGEYDFAFRSPPAEAPVLSVSAFEKLVATPALIWMKHFLGVEAEDGGSPLQAATGQWVHRWLAAVAGNEAQKAFVPLPSRAETDARIRRAAERKTAVVKHLCTSVGKTVPDWWTSGWQNALHLARHLGSRLANAPDWKWMATEWTIEADEPVHVGDGATLSFRGRIDLLLARSESVPTSAATELWILDYKTGSTKALVPAKDRVEKRKTRLHNQLVKGEALQLGLYALAMRQAGADDVLLSILSPVVREVAPQLSVSDIAAHEEVFAELARMQQSGVFGMYGVLRPAFGYTPAYPLATLSIDPDLLDMKWELTHPALAREEEEWDSW